MSVPRFFVPGPLASGARLALPDTVAHHALRVLRLAPGTPMVLFDGSGGAYEAVLALDGKRGMAEIRRFLPGDAELGGRITLVQGIAAGDKMDWIVEKAVELGAHAVVPVAAQRSVLRLSGERLDKRLQHWRRVALAACEQCGRNRPPPVHAPTSLAAWLAQPGGLRLLCHPEAAQPLAAALAAADAPQGIELLVGPEGGWSDEELAAARAAGAVAVRFGERVLRTETAGLALIAAVSALRGWQDG